MHTLVNTTNGQVAGVTSADGAVGIFKGIPYAAPPIGALRWKPPRRAVSWSGIRPALEFGQACSQPLMPHNAMFFGGVHQTSEDCLYLNVYTGGLGGAEKRPVLVWLHHGGFLVGWSGAPIYDGQALARQGIVMVSLNYRLGRLGFLAHPALSAEDTGHCSGNFGLQDQINALEWVRENIAAFGGDPDCVTLYGVSAGSYSVSALMSAPAAKGLFHRAIAGSGGAFGPLADSTEIGDFCQTLAGAERAGSALMSAMGAQTVDDMRCLSVKQLLNTRPADFTQVYRGILDSSYPIIDGKVLREEPYRTFARHAQNDVPLMTGSTADESGIFTADTELFISDYKGLLGEDFDRFSTLYRLGSEPTIRCSKAASADRLFSWQNWAWASCQAATGSAAVYYYHFAQAPPVPDNTFLEQAMEPSLGAFHTAELFYSLRNLSCRAWPWSDIDFALSDTLSAYWLAFMRTGNPNNAACPHWPAFQAADPRMMRLAGSSTGVANAPSPLLAERLAFWEHVYAKARKRDC